VNEHEHPPDVVRPRGLTVEALHRMNASADADAVVTVSGEILTDPDGVPVGVGPSVKTTAVCSGITVSRRELDRLGVTEDQFPNINFR
jgi:hypothetical protein